MVAKFDQVHYSPFTALTRSELRRMLLRAATKRPTVLLRLSVASDVGGALGELAVLERARRVGPDPVRRRTARRGLRPAAGLLVAVGIYWSTASSLMRASQTGRFHGEVASVRPTPARRAASRARASVVPVGVFPPVGVPIEPVVEEVKVDVEQDC